MNLAAFSMSRRPIVFTLVAMLFAWGVAAYQSMPRREDPEFTIRTCVVTTSWPGAPTITVEELITDRLEETLDGIEEIEHLRSTTTNGLSVIYVDLFDQVQPQDIQNVWDKVRAKVANVRMPDPAVRPLVNDEFGDTMISGQNGNPFWNIRSDQELEGNILQFVCALLADQQVE